MQAQADTVPQALLDQQRSCHCSRVSLVSQWHIPYFIVCPCHGGVHPARVGLPTQDRRQQPHQALTTPLGAPQCLAPVLDSERAPQQQLGSSLSLPVRAYSARGPVPACLEQPAFFQQHQPAENDLTPLTHAGVTETSCRWERFVCPPVNPVWLPRRSRWPSVLALLYMVLGA